MKATFVIAVLGLMAVPAVAQTLPTTTPMQNPASMAGSPVRKLLVDGFEIKTGFSDNNGGAYMVLQKATSAYLCHSSPSQSCEKLN